MTAATLTFDISRSETTVAACAGRVLLLAGITFGSANLYQWAVLTGAVDLHPVTLAVSWILAVGGFLFGLARLRRLGGEAGRRVAGWSRFAILAQIAIALAMAAVSAATGDWGLMRWAAIAGLVLYAVAWAVAAVRTETPNMGVLFLVTLAGAGAAAILFGTPDQYLINACTYALVALLPGFWLALGRRL